MRVQDLLLTALFLEGIAEALVVIQRRLRAFKGMAEPEKMQLRSKMDLRFVALCTFGFPFAAMPTRHHSSPKRYWTLARDGVMLSHTREEIRARIPFGASHRVNFDTPPLKGNCPDTLVSRQIPRKHGMEVTMGDVQTMRDRPKEKLRGRERRSLNLSTKLTVTRGKSHRRRSIADGQDAERMGTRRIAESRSRR